MGLLPSVVTGNQIKASDLNRLLAAVVAQSYTISGHAGAPAVPGPGSLTLTYGAQEAVVNNGSSAVYVYAAAGTRALAANTDSYFDLGYGGVPTYNGSTPNGSWTVQGVANGAGAPAQPANTLRLWKVVTGASAISGVQLLATGAPRGGVLQCVICQQTSDITIPGHSSTLPYSPTFSIAPGITTLFDNTRVRVRWTTKVKNNDTIQQEILFSVTVDATEYVMGGIDTRPSGSGNVDPYTGVCTTPPLLAGAHTVQLGYLSTGASTFSINAASDPSFNNAILEIEEIA